MKKVKETKYKKPIPSGLSRTIGKSDRFNLGAALKTLNKGKKTLAMIVLGAGLLFGSGIKANAQTEDYRKHLVHEEWVMALGGIFYNREYDVNKDGITDVGELYTDEEVKEPFLYGFNKNKNKNFEAKEIFIDEAMDSWNGNEVPYIKYIESKIKNKISL